ncbi:MAG: ABC transporter ATP-binding protein [Ruminococcaceae bacterium]|nr:ABC transporter ATP-binding protein [Oscillospiraceae bacterium]
MHIFRMLSYIFSRKQRWQFLGIFLLQLFATLLDFFGIALIMPFVNILITPTQIDGTWWAELVRSITGATEIKDILLFLTLLMIAIYVVKNAFLLFLTGLQTRFNYKNHIRLGSKMITCYMHKPYTYHLQRNTSEIVRNINQDVNSAFSVISGLFALVSDILIIVFLVVYLFAVDPWMTLAVMIALSFCSAVYFLIVRRKIRTFGQEDREITAKMMKAILQSMGGIKEVKIMGREQFFADVYTAAGQEMVYRKRRYAILSAIPSRLIETLCMGGILSVIAIKIVSGEELVELVPGLSAFAVAAIRLLPRANSINAHINGITYALPALESLYEELIDSEKLEKERQEEIARKKAEKKTVALGKENDIFVKNVTFTYPEKEEPVLKNVNLNIPHGTSVGIIGVTGAGKTTLVDVILGVLKPQEGTICYGTLDIHEDYAEWQKHIGYIPQTIYLTDETIRKNVALGIPEDQIDDKAVWKALENAQIADFVRSLEEGLDTVVGERGVRISGGQRQRIGIARALYHDPEILFFDEATSSLDNETEAAVMESIKGLSGNKTMIIVAHRLTTIEHCDKVFKVEKNVITETKLHH